MREIQYQDFLKLLEIHKPAEIKREHIEIAKEEKPNTEPLVDIKANYPTIESTLTGGYILPTEMLPTPFIERLINLGVGTRDIYHEQTRMIEHMIENAVLKGNNSDKNKKIYLLWHKCNNGKEIYIADQGDVEWDLDKVLTDNKKIQEQTGLDILFGRSEEFEYFKIKEVDEMKGTLLRIVLEKSEAKPCFYFGHKLFAKTT